MKVYDIAVVGAGPAGIMAALAAKGVDSSLSVCVIDGNDTIGRKLAITGGGRCNFTNDIDISMFFDRVVTNPRFLYSAFERFSNRDLIDFVKGLSIDYTVEKDNDNKVYLKSGNSHELIDRLYERLEDEGVDIFTGNRVTDVDLDGDIKTLFFKKGIVKAEMVIFSTGGFSYSSTGSDGFMTLLLKEKGYHIIDPVPALVPVNIDGCWVTDIPGVSVKGVALSIHLKDGVCDKKELRALKKIAGRTVSGDIIFTHRGIGGPVSLKVSSYINRNIGKFFLVLDLLPGVSDEELFRIMKSDPKKSLFSNLKGLLPGNLLKKVLDESDFADADTGNFSHRDFEVLNRYIKNINLPIKSIMGIESATVTSGGISVKDISPGTMESKIHGGVYFAGEMIDVDALTGGFNLQIAFSTGYAAGVSAANSKRG